MPVSEKFAAELVPFVPDRARLSLASEYASAADYKALALNANGGFSFSLGQQSEEAAKNVALEQCQKRADAVQSPRSCELYAVGNGVIYAHGHPPMPPLPWIVNDPSTQRRFAAKDVPMVHDSGRARLEGVYLSDRKNKAVAIGPGGAFFFNVGIESVEESARRILETCGAVAGVACMIVAVDNTFVVPVPTTLKVSGFFRADRSPLIAGNARDEVARKLADASSGWNAVAIGRSGRPGLGLQAASEESAVDQAQVDCAKRDSDCHIIAIGPFTVAPN
jgi:adenylate cyclase